MTTTNHSQNKTKFIVFSSSFLRSYNKTSKSYKYMENAESVTF